MSTNETSLWNRFKHAAYDYQEWIDGAKQSVTNGTRRVAYGYQEAMDEFTGSVVDADPQKVDNYDRLAGAGAVTAAALTSPLWGPAALAGCGSDSSTSVPNIGSDAAGDGEASVDAVEDDTVEEAKADTEKTDVYTDVAGPELPGEDVISEDVLPELPEFPDLKDTYDTYDTAPDTTGPDTKADTAEDVSEDTTGDVSGDVFPWDAADVTPADAALETEADVAIDSEPSDVYSPDITPKLLAGVSFCFVSNDCNKDPKLPCIDLGGLIMDNGEIQEVTDFSIFVDPNASDVLTFWSPTVGKEIIFTKTGEPTGNTGDWSWVIEGDMTNITGAMNLIYMPADGIFDLNFYVDDLSSTYKYCKHYYTSCSAEECSAAQGQ
jgi:hypothetical protein